MAQVVEHQTCITSRLVHCQPNRFHHKVRVKQLRWLTFHAEKQCVTCFTARFQPAEVVRIFETGV